MNKAIGQRTDKHTQEINARSHYDWVTPYMEWERQHPRRATPAVRSNEHPVNNNEPLGGIVRGVVHAAEGFIEFFAQPTSTNAAVKKGNDDVSRHIVDLHHSPSSSEKSAR